MQKRTQALGLIPFLYLAPFSSLHIFIPSPSYRAEKRHIVRVL